MLTPQTYPSSLESLFPEIFPQEFSQPLAHIGPLDFNTWPIMDTFAQEVNAHESINLPHLGLLPHEVHEQAGGIDASDTNARPVVDSPMQIVKLEDRSDSLDRDVYSIAVQPQRAPRVKGRSGGEKSSKTIKLLRIQASKGDVNAALKLGWGVSRLTEIFNMNKASRGEVVRPGQPIDDPDLLAKIAEKHRYQASIQRRRLEKLRAQANEGDLEAAKKLKFGKRKMNELFPSRGGNSKDVDQGGQDEGAQDVAQAAEEPSTAADEVAETAEQVIRSEAAVLEYQTEDRRSPAQPFDFAQERLPHVCESIHQAGSAISLDSNDNTSNAWNATGSNGLPHFGTFIAGTQSSIWSEQNMPPYPPQTRAARYPAPQAQISPELEALNWEYSAALQQCSLAQENLRHVQHKLENLRAAEARAAEVRAAEVRAAEARVAETRAAEERAAIVRRDRAVKRKRQSETSEDIRPDKAKAIKVETTSRKGKKQRLTSNFPPEPTGDVSAVSERMQTQTPMQISAFDFSDILG